MYFVTGAPPSVTGAVQCTVALAFPLIAVTPSGALGVVINACGRAADAVALASVNTMTSAVTRSDPTTRRGARSGRRENLESLIRNECESAPASGRTENADRRYCTIGPLLHAHWPNTLWAKSDSHRISGALFGVCCHHYQRIFTSGLKVSEVASLRSRHGGLGVMSVRDSALGGGGITIRL